MGLLDDAIREHLELKRRTGAAPGDIARVEQEALHPDTGDAYAAWDGGLEANADSPVEADQPVGPLHDLPVGVAPVGLDTPVDAVASARGTDFSTVGQETAELDMRTVLDDDFDASNVPLSPGSAAEDSLEWEDSPSPESVREEARDPHDDRPAEDSQEHLPFE